MTTYIDLHAHSKRSDGIPDAEDLPFYCKDVEVVALCDHDTVAGVPSAVEAFQKSPVTFIPGIELSCIDSEGRFPKSFHILGLNIDYKNQVLLYELESIRKRTQERSRIIMDSLRENGFKMDRSILKKEKGIITIFEIFESIQDAPDFNYDLNDYKSLVRFTDSWIKKPRKHHVFFEKMTFQRAIELIHIANGKAVLAHPGHTLRKNTNLVELAIEELIKAGLDGIEVFTPKHNETETNMFHKIALQKGLIETAGSDFHGREEQNIGGINTFGLKFDQMATIKKILYG